MKWPEAPTCHGEISPGLAQRGFDMSWRGPRDTERTCECGYAEIGPYGESFRTCSYCGSIHPEDLAHFLQQPQHAKFSSPVCRVTLGGSDWKYGYPHKFYVEGIPNTLAGQLVNIGSSYRSFESEPTAEKLEEAKRDMGNLKSVEARVIPPAVNKYWRVHVHGRSSAPATAHAKFYTSHLEDQGYDDEALELILKLVSEASGILFSRESPDSRKILYSAPYHGYQRA